MKTSFFENRKLVIATMHQKERVIAPIVESSLKVECVKVKDLNTDALGTFTGEIERKMDPISTARLKCQKALEHTGLDLAIASEGSFGAHPDVFFAKADDEIILLLDTKNKIEIVGRKLSLETNFDGAMIHSWEGMKRFAEQALFPSHALILRKAENSHDIYEKGITAWSHLEDLCAQYLENQGAVWVETDMRAMYNPTRMHVILEATQQLVEHALSTCSICSCPGFVVHETKKGLPCALCRQPTRSVQFLMYLCKRCGHEEIAPRTDGKTEEDPMYCDFCNP